MTRALLLALLTGCVPDPLEVDGTPPLPDTDEVLHSDDPATGRPTDGRPFHDTGARHDGALLVGTWRDLDDWDLWSDLVRFGSDWHAIYEAWGFSHAQRFRVRVQDGGGGVADARVSLVREGETTFVGHTDALGEVELFGGLYDLSGGPWSLSAVAGDRAAQTFGVVPSWDEPWRITMTDGVLPRPTGADVVLLADAREAHADALAWLQTHLATILEEGLGDGPARVATGWFDHEQASLGALDDDRGAAADTLARATATGGPDARLTEALEAAAALPWAPSARARRLVLLLGEVRVAEPHLSRLHAATAALAAHGVRVHAIALDDHVATGFLLRNLAVTTGGTWSFALASGPPADSPLVGAYTVDDLDTLLIRELRALVGP